MTPLWLQTSTQLHIGESAEISGLFYSLKILAGAFVEVLVVSFVLVFSVFEKHICICTQFDCACLQAISRFESPRLEG